MYNESNVKLEGLRLMTFCFMLTQKYLCQTVPCEGCGNRVYLNINKSKTKGFGAYSSLVVTFNKRVQEELV